MARILIDCTGEKCPKPLYRVKRIVRVAEPGDLIEVIGDDERSKGEIPLAIEGFGYEILEISEEEGRWKISFLKGRKNGDRGVEEARVQQGADGSLS